MGSAQLTYGNRAVAYAGMPAHTRIRGTVLSRACETAAGIDFGKVVSCGSVDGGCVIGGTSPLGVALRDHGQGMDEDSAGLYTDESMVSVIDKDFVWVTTASTSGSYRAKVYYNTTTGAIVITATPSASEKLIGYLAQTLTAAGLVKIFVNTDLYYDSVDEAVQDSDIDDLETAVDLVTPTAPVTALAAAAGDTQSVITWVDPADADLDHIVVKVSVTSTGAETDEYLVAAAAQTVTATGLTNGTQYTVEAWAIDTDGNASAIESVNVTPSA